MRNYICLSFRTVLKHTSAVTTLSEIKTISETIISPRVDPSTFSEINISTGQH